MRPCLAHNNMKNESLKTKISGLFFLISIYGMFTIGNENIHADLDNNDGLIERISSTTEVPMAYFLVGDRHRYPEGGESYVLPVPLKQTNAIKHAREIIDEGHENVNKTIVIARIGNGADGINRDYLPKNHHLWSWHVIKFEEFAESVVGTLDGKPSLVEEDVEGWINSPLKKGMIGFLNYTVLEEIEVPLVDLKALRLDVSRIQLLWPDLGSNYRYTLEKATSLTPADWQGLEQGAWPSRTKSWVINELPKENQSYYRIKIERTDPF